ncbi:cobyrinate a,c-diamide synthase [Arsenicitalea aurantiaca]|uniref:Hydrogenobyrinate a,c-diamide synthase n=1 Tax=Arsenicitalea aurantiaca TaxID=1783274 RepID=A0A433X3Y8_9HYPH|nr:cobyrinate a,c-diamide synthase [Arsenicitalea aurantiaca]RUT28776.1 cobyrinate a,c-diamide synthase [Arsenicitalea aurantiaca]
MADPRGVIIAAPRSGSGKTLVTLGLAGALRMAGLVVAPAKTGPDYIDGQFLARAAGREAVNLDPWAMSPMRLRSLARRHAEGADILLLEGVMGLFDGAADGTGSTGDLAQALDLPVILVVDADRQSQSIAPLVAGFAQWRTGVRVAGIIVNRSASTRHEAMVRRALEATQIPVLGVLPRRDKLSIPSRQLGLVLPGELDGIEETLRAAAGAIADYVDLPSLLSLTRPLSDDKEHPGLPPLGQRIAIARDAAFGFLYPHFLDDWQRAGASLSFFSPLADEGPAADADAVFLPGGYPELHGPALASATRFAAGLRAARDRGALVYGECGGFMVLGERLVDATGRSHPMTGLLPIETRIDRPRRLLGYRRLAHMSPLPWPARLMGHEFHYSSARRSRAATPLFAATDALGEEQPPMGAREGRVMGSYAHVIDAASPDPSDM